MHAAIALERPHTWAAFLQRALARPVVLGGMLVCLTFCFCCLRFNDPDTWLHLKLGQEIWQTHAIPQTDHWSFTVAGKARIDHEWVAQLSMYLAYSVGGYQGLLLWLCVLGSALVALVYALCYRYCGNATIAMLGGFLAFFFGTIGFAIRPHMIGYALLAVELLVMERAWSGRPRVLWCLPPLFVLWVNCHGSWALGIGLLAAASVCSYIVGRGPDKRVLAGVLALCAGALIVNPIGIKLLLYPLNVFAKQRDSLGFLTEWLPLTVQDVRGVAVFAILAAIGVAALLNKVKATVFEALVLAAVSFLAIQHIRMLFVFGIVSAPIVCRLLRQLRVARDPKPDHLPSNALLLVTAAVLCFAMFPRVEKIQENIELNNPVKAIRFIRQAGLEGNMMHDYMWGGYLAWALPEHKVFIDGRGDIFDWAGLLARYRDWATVQADPARLLDDFNISFCLLPVTAQEAYVMPRLQGWKKLYSDDVAVIFGRDRVTPSAPR